MNKKETTKKDAVENNSLMRKTKTQLVELIFRKDSVERNLREDIKRKEKEFDSITHDLKVIRHNYVSLQNEYHSVCDDKALIECELKNTINKQRGLIWFLVIIFVISITANIALYLI